MHAPTPSASASDARSAACRPTPRTSSTPPVTASTPAAAAGETSAPSAITLINSTSTGAAPRGIGYANDRSAREYTAASSAKYVSSSAADAAMYGQASASTRHVSAAGSANTAAPTTSATAVVACVSPGLGRGGSLPPAKPPTPATTGSARGAGTRPPPPA